MVMDVMLLHQNHLAVTPYLAEEGIDVPDWLV